MTDITPYRRLGARVEPDIYALLIRAAELEGRTLSDFVVSAARDAAQRVIAQVEVIRFGKDASVAFAELLTEPGGPRIKLAEATPVHNDLFGAP